nr:MAG TPA: hypothetical protein [Caudoviricetes sp.]
MQFSLEIQQGVVLKWSKRRDSKSNWLFGSGFPILLGFMRVFRLRE